MSTVTQEGKSQPLAGTNASTTGASQRDTMMDRTSKHVISFMERLRTTARTHETLQTWSCRNIDFDHLDSVADKEVDLFQTYVSFYAEGIL